MSLNYQSGDDLITETSFAAAAQAAGAYGGADELAGEPPKALAAKRGGSSTSTSTGPVAVQQRVVVEKVGRNEPCPCGSGKKYKKCHGA
jgi:preprotein translocase subunit SecA